MIKLTLGQLFAIAHAAEAILGEEHYASFVELCEDSVNQLAVTVGRENTDTRDGMRVWRYEHGKIFLPKLKR